MKHYRTLDTIHCETNRYETGVTFKTIDTTKENAISKKDDTQNHQPQVSQQHITHTIKYITMAIILLCGVLHAQFASFYSDHKSFEVGDILTVNISETSRATSSSQSRTARNQDHNMNIEAGTGPMRFIPATGMGGSSSNNFRGDANTTRDASLSSKMTVRIVDIDLNGNLIIEGSREVLINGENEITSLQGIVRPQDVSSNNTIHSHNIADAKISYTGKGAITQGAKVGFISRIFNFLF